MENLCNDCKYATWDYYSFYNTTARQYFVDGCKLEGEAEIVAEDGGRVVECDKFKEVSIE